MRNKIFYSLKPFIPRPAQLVIRRGIAAYKKKKHLDTWPIDPQAGTPPLKWKGWPDGKKFALVLSHDVDTQKGHDSVIRLMDLEEQMGFRSTFNFVPERYHVSPDLIQKIKKRGFQVCVHGLKHDGRLFSSRKIFDQRAKKINGYLKAWNAIGFTSPSMHRKLEWMHNLNIRHSTATFDTDPFEPQPESVRTIFPFYVIKSRRLDGGYLELPYTLPQDHLLFVILKHSNIDIWQRKLAWIAEKGGMALLNTHSDYMRFDGGKLSLEEYPAAYYTRFLEHVQTTYAGEYWHALPREVVLFWDQQMNPATSSVSSG